MVGRVGCLYWLLNYWSCLGCILFSCCWRIVLEFCGLVCVCRGFFVCRGMVLCGC